MKGFFKGNLERLNEYFKEDIIEHSFGTQQFASSFLFNDVYPTDNETISFETRSQIAIDRQTQGVQKGALFFIECLSKGAKLAGSINIRNLRLYHLGQLYAIIMMANDQNISIGFNKTRGYGKIKFSIKELIIDTLPNQWIFNSTDGKIIISDGIKTIEFKDENFNTNSLKTKKSLLMDNYQFKEKEASMIMESCLEIIKKGEN